jgi:ATP-dependent Clp endopeptidase proteolytic subunit ClpP
MDKRPFRTTRRPQNYAQSRPGWYTIKAQASGPARIDIYDEIGFMAVSAQSFITDLANLDCAADVEMHLNSPGGDVFDGIAIYNALKQRQGQVSVVVDGLAASAASFIAQAASPGQLSMAPHSQMMIHDAFGMAIGNASDMQEMASLLDKASDNIAGIYADRTGKPADYWREQMRNETWLSDQEAVAAGLADKIHGQEAPSSDWDLSVFAKYAGVQPAGPPADLRVPAMTNSASVVVNADGNHAPMTGTHKHSHPAYGAQGTDSVHSHEHEHEGDANHGHHKQAAAPDEGTSAAAVVISAYCRPCCLTAGADARFCNSCGTRLSMADESGWVQDPDGT